MLGLAKQCGGVAVSSQDASMAQSRRPQKASLPGHGLKKNFVRLLRTHADPDYSTA